MTSTTNGTSAVDNEATKQERDRLMSQAYGVAQKRLRENNKAEFDGYYSEECAARGIDWQPKKTKEELAYEQVQALLTEFPSLAERLGTGHAQVGATE